MIPIDKAIDPIPIPIDKTKQKNDNHLMIPIDKAINRNTKRTKQSLLTKRCRKKCEKSTETVELQISSANKSVAEKLKLYDRINITAERGAFINLKDHKQNFQNEPNCLAKLAS